VSVPTGTIETLKCRGASLEGNLEGDSADRDVSVYLPPSYRTQKTRRYPVIYLLHGAGGTDRSWMGRQGNLPDSADRQVAVGRIHELIIVMPNAFTLHRGSMYSDSVTIGDWETYIAKDLVSCIDRHYRTIVDRGSRGLAGASMGGYGAIRIAMKRPDVFSNVYMMSACCLAAEDDPSPATMAAAAAIQTPEAAQATEPGGPVNLALMHAAAWSPNPARPPLFLDLPFEGGHVRREIAAKWVANAPLALLDQSVPRLKRYHAIAMDIGTKDALLASNRELHEAMRRLGIAHLYEEYDGGHNDRRAERLEMKALPFFSDHLSLAATSSERSH